MDAFAHIDSLFDVSTPILPPSPSSQSDEGVLHDLEVNPFSLHGFCVIS